MYSMNAQNILVTHFSARYPKMPPSVSEHQAGDPAVAFAFDHPNIKIGDMWKTDAYARAIEQSFIDIADIGFRLTLTGMFPSLCDSNIQLLNFSLVQDLTLLRDPAIMRSQALGSPYPDKSLVVQDRPCKHSIVELDHAQVSLCIDEKVPTPRIQDSS
jgi:ribonuclease Z